MSPAARPDKARGSTTMSFEVSFRSTGLAPAIIDIEMASTSPSIQRTCLGVCMDRLISRKAGQAKDGERRHRQQQDCGHAEAIRQVRAWPPGMGWPLMRPSQTPHRIALACAATSTMRPGSGHVELSVVPNAAHRCDEIVAVVQAERAKQRVVEKRAVVKALCSSTPSPAASCQRRIARRPSMLTCSSASLNTLSCGCRHVVAHVGGTCPTIVAASPAAEWPPA